MRSQRAVSVSGGGAGALDAAFSKAIQGVEDALPKSGPWAANVAGDLVGGTSQARYARLGDLDSFSLRVRNVGLGLDFAIGAGFQLANDLNNPLLTPGQVALRAGTAGVGGAGLGYLVGAAGLYCGAAAIVCVPIGAVAGGLIWSEAIQPLVFKAPIF